MIDTTENHQMTTADGVRWSFRIMTNVNAAHSELRNDRIVPSKRYVISNVQFGYKFLQMIISIYLLLTREHQI